MKRGGADTQRLISTNAEWQKFTSIHDDSIYRRNKILTRKDGGGTGTDCRNVLMGWKCSIVCKGFGLHIDTHQHVTVHFTPRIRSLLNNMDATKLKIQV